MTTHTTLNRCTSCMFGATAHRSLWPYSHDAGAEWPAIVVLHDDCADAARAMGVRLTAV
jgi:hypothetical protein